MTTTTVTVPVSLLRHHPNHVTTYLAIRAFLDAGNDHPRIKDIADAVGGLTESSVSRRLHEMEEAGLITRRAWTRGEGGRRVTFEVHDPARATPRLPAAPGRSQGRARAAA